MEWFLLCCYVKKYNVMKKVNKYLVVLFIIFLVIMLSVVMMRRNSIGCILKGFL